ncbi:hypothetical protein FB451DRAFT_1439302 [Mycena latifolia]|nr:hypothetical protein FB451DRAFT_1466246 [Mycena latifolia]KAJ7483372.1 hypothetical protein FB451DRAFT_1439302 [Mycena latifolia]
MIMQASGGHIVQSEAQGVADKRCPAGAESHARHEQGSDGAILGRGAQERWRLMPSHAVSSCIPTLRAVRRLAQTWERTEGAWPKVGGATALASLRGVRLSMEQAWEGGRVGCRVDVHVTKAETLHVTKVGGGCSSGRALTDPKNARTRGRGCVCGAAEGRANANASGGGGVCTASPGAPGCDPSQAGRANALGRLCECERRAWLTQAQADLGVGANACCVLGAGAECARLVGALRSSLERIRNRRAARPARLIRCVSAYRVYAEGVRAPKARSHAGQTVSAVLRALQEWARWCEDGEAEKRGKSHRGRALRSDVCRRASAREVGEGEVRSAGRRGGVSSLGVRTWWAKMEADGEVREGEEEQGDAERLRDEAASCISINGLDGGRGRRSGGELRTPRKDAAHLEHRGLALLCPLFVLFLAIVHGGAVGALLCCFVLLIILVFGAGRGRRARRTGGRGDLDELDDADARMSMPQVGGVFIVDVERRRRRRERRVRVRRVQQHYGSLGGNLQVLCARSENSVAQRTSLARNREGPSPFPASLYTGCRGSGTKPVCAHCGSPASAAQQLLQNALHVDNQRRVNTTHISHKWVLQTDHPTQRPGSAVAPAGTVFKQLAVLETRFGAVQAKSDISLMLAVVNAKGKEQREGLVDDPRVKE